MAVSIHIKNVMKKYEDNTVIRDLTADINSGELFTLLGPSGCGKTTLLRMIAGFNSVEHGTIAFDDTIINDIPVHKRSFGMVFQNYAIFPNMTVYRNIEYGLKNKHLSRDEIRRRVEEIMEVVQIARYQDRYPDKLSGGQQQRVALARAIAVRPQVLLMDEPLSNLDAKLRLEMREAIRDIQKKIGITTVYVTHDQEEALAISDRIAIMNKGDIQQIEVPERIYSRPCNTFVANFIGHSNRLRGTVEEIKEVKEKEQAGEGGVTIKIEGRLTVDMKGTRPLQTGQELLVYVRPEEFVIIQESQENQESRSPENYLKGTVRVKQFLGRYVNYIIDLGASEPVEVTSDTNSALKIYEPGDEVLLTVNTRRINLFTPDTEVSLMEGVSSNVLRS